MEVDGYIKARDNIRAGSGRLGPPLQGERQGIGVIGPPTVGGGTPTAGSGRNLSATGHIGGVPSLEDVRRVLSRNDKARSPSIDTHGLLVQACGRAIQVPEGRGVTLMLHHVQKALQDELKAPDQTFDIQDKTGNRIRTDQDLRDAVMAGRIPLNAKLSDSNARLASIQSDIKWVCQQVGSLRGELESQRIKHQEDIESLRNELYSVIETSKDLMMKSDQGGGGKYNLDIINADQGVPLASMQQFADLESHIQGMGLKMDEMSRHFRNTMSEYSRHHDRSASQANDAIARIVDRCAGLEQRLANAEIGGLRGGQVNVNRRTSEGRDPLGSSIDGPRKLTAMDNSFNSNDGTRRLNAMEGRVSPTNRDGGSSPMAGSTTSSQPRRPIIPAAYDSRTPATTSPTSQVRGTENSVGGKLNSSPRFEGQATIGLKAGSQPVHRPQAQSPTRSIDGTENVPRQRPGSFRQQHLSLAPGSAPNSSPSSLQVQPGSLTANPGMTMAKGQAVSSTQLGKVLAPQ